ncbi:phosphoadenosine phosphosulfate reductase family protein [Balneola sp. MJW-20]|uniref:phosphoadenosine phosphosulfate reductase domain-containing protein n=1 Tax=Gracilimonas aurantiaca TaxID=3234185 RepID=UPI0034653804
MSKVRHVLGISGGKDSAALALYMQQYFPSIELDLYSCDTGRELDETYELIDKLEAHLGLNVTKLHAVETAGMTIPNFEESEEISPFDYFLKEYGGFLPSTYSRWCTKDLKLKPFEEYIGDDPTVSYVAIRGDENREAYVSRNENVQTIFPFKKNIWSFDVLDVVMDYHNTGQLKDIYENIVKPDNLNRILEEVERPISMDHNFNKKVRTLLDLDVTAFNKAVFHFLKKTEFPLSRLSEEEFPLLDKSHVPQGDRIFVREQVFDLLEETVGVPEYYKKLEYEVDGEVGTYSRTRSGCFFCFYQQKIEWIWLYENNPEKFEAAKKYEKDGFTWIENESLDELTQPDRIAEIKRQHLEKKKNNNGTTSKTLLNNLLGEDEKGDYFDKEDEDYAGCTVCFI